MSYVIGFLSGAAPVLVALLILGLLILLHEAGHFFVARACKMRVEIFSIGFGRALWKKKRGDTTYQISVFPLGGYVQIAGMAADIPSKDDASTEKNETSIEDKSASKSQDTSEPLSLEKDPHSYENRPAWQRFLTVLAGPLVNYLIAAIIFVGLAIALGIPKSDQVFIKEVSNASPASKAGLKAGDQILAVDQKSFQFYDDFGDLLQDSQSKVPQPIVLSILRQEKPQNIIVSPIKDGKRWIIGFAPKIKQMKRPAGEVLNSLRYGFWQPVRALLLLPKKFSLKSMSGPLGIVAQIRENIADSKGERIIAILSIMAAISAMLAIMNILPLPALDGGRLVFIAWEIITRRPANKKVEQWVHTIGIIFLLLLFVGVTINDLSKIVMAAINFFKGH